MPEARDLPSSCRALVLVGSPAYEERLRTESRPSLHRSPRGVASFLTQLIATAQKVPQARERRRADPAEAIAAYQAAIAKLQKLNVQ